jgi:hypothetical protein
VATVTSLTADAIMALVNSLVTSASIDGSGHLILTTYAGNTLDVGGVAVSVVSASETQAGILKLASVAMSQAGTDTATAVTPAGLHAALTAGAGAISPIASDYVFSLNRFMT